MATVFDVADFFIDIANMSEDDQMTNLKLNKLLYYAQGVSLPEPESRYLMMILRHGI